MVLPAEPESTTSKMLSIPRLGECQPAWHHIPNSRDSVEQGIARDTLSTAVMVCKEIEPAIGDDRTGLLFVA